jgi:putative membrane protein
MFFLFRAVVTAVAVWFVTLMPLDVVVTGGNDTWWSRALVFLGIGAILVAVNWIVKPIVNLVMLPIRILTLGLFALVINWAMLTLTAWITSHTSFGALEVGGFWKTLLAAFLIAIITVLLGASKKKSKKRN